MSSGILLRRELAVVVLLGADVTPLVSDWEPEFELWS